MKNEDIAHILTEIGFFLELKNDNPFKGQAYKKAAQKIVVFEENLAELIKSQKEIKISGIGNSIKKTLDEIILEGQSSLLRELHQEIPLDLLRILAVPGIGVKVVKQIIAGTSAQTIDDVEKLAKGKEIRKLPGLGSKTELALLKGIELLKGNIDQFPIGITKPIAQEILMHLNNTPILEKVALVGDLSRGSELVTSIDFLIACLDFSEFTKWVIKLPHIKELVEEKSDYAIYSSWLGLKIIFIRTSLDEFYYQKVKHTGSKNHWSILSDRLLNFGISKKDFNSEEELYQAIKLPTIPTVLRETGLEIQTIEQIGLIDLLEIDDIKGDLHIHSKWSDGVNSIEEIVESACKMGYQYIAITDHSQSLKIANGLTTARLEEQSREILNVQEKFPDIKILKGVEVDILKDGKLDYQDDFLKELDIVVGSVHSGFKMEKDLMTERIVQAMKNPHVDIIAHPTGRLLARRPPYALDVEKILEAAVKTETILEINSSPDRLDLKDNYVKLAKDLGAKIAINTDAHSVERLSDIEYGVVNAQKGWLTKFDVVNTWPYEDLHDWLIRENS